MKFYPTIFFILLTLPLFSQSIVGTWKSVDDETGDARSHVEIYEQDGLIYGKITKLLDAPSSSLCDQCEGDKKDTPIIGLVIIEKVKPYKDYWRKGKILDPEDGNIYSCTLWLKNGNLKVKAKHWTGLFATQTWLRVK